MLKVSNIRLRDKPNDLIKAAADFLKIPISHISSAELFKLSIDARRKHDVCFVCTLLIESVDENALLELDNVSRYKPEVEYAFPVNHHNPPSKPVIVGAGPAGLFAALCLSESGVSSVILERGKPVLERAKDVLGFWQNGVLNETSNVQFGEGGAGTFSDGKLTCGLGDKRIPFILKAFVRFGAPPDILYLAKPHIGTDKLRVVVENMRNHLISRGCEFRFQSILSAVRTENNAIASIYVDSPGGGYEMKTEKLILATGNSARDTFEMLRDSGVMLAAKNFSIGVRIEHKQNKIDMSQYGTQPPLRDLPPAEYKLSAHLENGRTVYTFCVCPGGAVIAAASEKFGVVTNGMSHYARDGENCNGALLVTVTPDDFQNLPLGGIALQRRLENAAFKAGGSDYSAPVQLVSDFLLKRASAACKSVKPSYTPSVKYGNLWDMLPDFICGSIAEALPVLNRRVSGFSDGDAILTAVETRSSSPVRILRENYESVSTRGIFPCGEGAGYAGGIMSAAVDGVKTAEAILNQS